MGKQSIKELYIQNNTISSKVVWDKVLRYSEWPAGFGNTRILSRYPKE